MKNVHFTIDLIDGIAISGNTQFEVRKVLYEMHSAFYELCRVYYENHCDDSLRNSKKMLYAIYDAITTLEVSLDNSRLYESKSV